MTKIAGLNQKKYVRHPVLQKPVNYSWKNDFFSKQTYTLNSEGLEKLGVFQ